MNELEQIILVTDNQTTRKWFQHEFPDNTTYVRGIESSLEEALKQSPGLVFIALEDKKALECLETVRAFDRQIAIIIQSDNDQSDQVDRMVALGVVDIIRADHNRGLLKNKIDRIVLAPTESNPKPGSCFLSSDEFFATGQRMINGANPALLKVINLNINGFKFFNERYGITRGNALLGELSAICSMVITDCNGFGTRITGDEFAFVLEIDDFNFTRFKTSLVEALETLEAPLTLRMGVYSLPERVIPIRIGYDRAKLASNLALNNEMLNIVHYHDDMRKNQMFVQEIISSFKKSLHEGRFEIYYQPKFNLHDYSIIGAEALIRWNHPNYGFLAPDKFIPILEQNSLIKELDYFVFDKACGFMRDWLDEHSNLIPISVNLSRLDIHDERTLGYLEGLLEKYRLEPESLHLEITESYGIDDDLLIERVNEFKNSGFILEMDDFGSGYSSLNVLDELPVDVLKMDLRFILNKTRNNRVVDYVVDLANKLDLQLIVEGVESQEQIQALQEIGCIYGQGYLFAPPLKYDDFRELLEKNKIENQDGLANMLFKGHYYDKIYATIPIPIIHLDEALYVTYFNDVLKKIVKTARLKNSFNLGMNVAGIVSDNSYLDLMKTIKNLRLHQNKKIELEVELNYHQPQKLSFVIQKIRNETSYFYQLFMLTKN